MPRLITLVLFLLAASGILPGSAAASRHAVRPRAATASSAHTSNRALALDLALAAQGPTFVAPLQRGAAPHVAQRHCSGLAASTRISNAARHLQGDSGANRGAGWAMVRSGYRATGPPEQPEVSPPGNQLALPA